MQHFFNIEGPARHARFDLVLDIFRGRVPDGLLPIVGDPFGNVLCIKLSPPARGSIDFWDHEREVDEDEEPNLQNMTMLADCFTDFLDGLTQI